MPDEFNPFAAPASADVNESPPEVIDPEAEAIRRDHLGHEAAIRAAGLGCGVLALHFGLYAAASAVACVQLTRILAGRTDHSWTLMNRAIFLGVSAPILAALTVGSCSLARGLRRFRPRSQQASVVVLTLALVILAGVAIASPFFEGGWENSLAPCLIALVPLWALWLLRSSKGRMVFSLAYREVLEKTPHLKYRASRRFKLGLLASVLLIVLLIVIGALLGPFK